MSTIKSSAENLTLNADGANNDIKFQSNGSEVASIDQAGLVTGSKLNLTQSAGTVGTVTIGGTTNAYSAPVLLTVSDLGLDITDGTKHLASWASHGGSSHAGSAIGTRSNHDLALITNDTKRMVINTAGVVSVPVGIELGSGIDGTAANTLDDYEEGTWSPLFKGSTGSAGSWALSTITSTYTKIGRTVFVSCAGYLTNVGSWTGSAIITGLPFASTFGEHSPLAMSGFPNTTTYGTGAGSQPLITCYVSANSTQINFKSGAGQDPGCPYSIVRTGYYFQVSGTYTAT